MMTEIKTSIDPEDIEWEMDWSGLKSDGTRHYPDKPEKEMTFEPAFGLAMLLINEVIHLNCHWWEKTWPEEARELTHLGANCSDVFAWGCSDSESLKFKDIEGLYRMWAKDPRDGVSVWAIIRRKQMPQRPVERSIRAAGIWDLDALKVEHGLKANHYDGISSILAKRKYKVYCEWEQSRSMEPKPWDASWWEGWKEYTAANPDWNNDVWKAEEKTACEKWRIENGYEP